jgi:hypothetical protein
VRGRWKQSARPSLPIAAKQGACKLALLAAIGGFFKKFTLRAAALRLQFLAASQFLCGQLAKFYLLPH